MFTTSGPKHLCHWCIALMHFLHTFQCQFCTSSSALFLFIISFPHHFTCRRTSPRSHSSQSPTATFPPPARTRGQKIPFNFSKEIQFSSRRNATSDSSAMQPMREEIWSPLLQCLVATTLAPICPSMLYLQD